MKSSVLPYPIIDIHSHVLPGIDDGSRDMEESVRLLTMAYEQGIGAVFATPHYSGHRKNPNQEELRRLLTEKIREKLPDFRLYSGHENFYHEELPARILENSELRLAGGEHVLVEFDPLASYETIFRGIRGILGTGMTPVLAHVERYRCLRADENLKELLRCGCLLQMNFDSLTGNLFSANVRWCRRQVLDKRIFAMGTDMHRLDFRPPNIGPAVAWLVDHVGAEQLRAMLYENPLELTVSFRINQG